MSEPMSEDRLYVLGIAASNAVEDCLREIRRLRVMVGGLEEIRRADGKALEEITAYAHKLEDQRDDLQVLLREVLEQGMVAPDNNAPLYLGLMEALYAPRESEES